jgi:hypothetical protein
MAINSTTARADIFKEFRDVLNTNTTNVKVTNAFVNDVAVLPQIIINPAAMGRERQRFGTASDSYNRDGSIDIEIFAKKMQTLVTLADEVEQIITDNLDSLTVHNISIGASTSASIEVGSGQVHTITVPVSFMYRG